MLTNNHHTTTIGDLVTVQNAVTDCEAAYVQALVDCLNTDLEHEVRHQLPFYQERAFGQDETAPAYGLYQAQGGNHVYFLAGLMQRYLPGVVHSLYRAFDAAYTYAEWGQAATFARHKNMYDHPPEEDASSNTTTTTTTALPHPTTLGIRTMEYLHFKTLGRLGHHPDGESLFTMSIAWSEPDSYEGGWFQLLSSSAQFKVPRLSAVVFYSEALHAITRLERGTRTVLVTELWEYDAVPLGSARPSVAQFLQQQQQEGDDDDYEYDDDDDDYEYEDEEEQG